MPRTPWPHQQRTDKAVRAQYSAGKRSILIVSPTGSGKTYMGSRFACGGVAKGSRVLWLAHRDELIDQACESLREEGLSPGVIAPWAPRSDSPLQVGSIQTLLARGDMPDADIVVLDEAHHHVSPEWQQIPAHYLARKSVLLGLTATPQRGDGVALGNVFDSIVVACQPRELIDAGQLVRARVLRPARQTKHLAEHPVEAIRTLAADRRRIIIFASSVAHASKLAIEANALGISAASVDGGMKREARRDTIARFRRGEIRVLTNMHVLTEGFDCRETDCVILARGFSTEGAYIQAVGRGLRRADGKKYCLVLDLRGASLDHGLPDDDRSFTLDGRGISTTGELDPITQCSYCGLVFRANEFQNATCPACGTVRRGRELPSVRKQRLSEAAAGDGQDSREWYLSNHVLECLVKGKKVGQAKILWAVKYTPYGCPVRRWPNPAQLAMSGYNAALDFTTELAIINKARKTDMQPCLTGLRLPFPRAYAETKPPIHPAQLVQLLRQSLASGPLEVEIGGNRVRVAVERQEVAA